MKVAIVLFPGTNCERDTKYAFDILGCDTQIIWHKEREICADLVVLAMAIINEQRRLQNLVRLCKRL